jgi:hypothetical protein
MTYDPGNLDTMLRLAEMKGKPSKRENFPYVSRFVYLAAECATNHNGSGNLPPITEEYVIYP